MKTSCHAIPHGHILCLEATAKAPSHYMWDCTIMSLNVCKNLFMCLPLHVSHLRA